MSVTFEFDLTDSRAIRAGATFDETFTWLQGDTNTPVDLTGVSARMQLRVAVDVADPLVDLTTAGGGIVITSAQGKIRVIIAAATTASLPAAGVYDLILTWPDSSVQRLLEGKFAVSPRVTR